MKYMIDDGGNYFEAEHNIGGNIEVQKRPSHYCDWIDGAWVERANERINAVKLSKLVQIQRDRIAACNAHVTAHGRQWQADSASQSLLGQAITLATAGLPLPAVWRDADNSDMPVTSLSDLLAIAGAIALQTEAAYSESWTRKAALDAAITVDEVEAV